jgi:hypothetical protein
MAPSIGAETLQLVLLQADPKPPLLLQTMLENVMTRLLP